MAKQSRLVNISKTPGGCEITPGKEDTGLLSMGHGHAEGPGSVSRVVLQAWMSPSSAGSSFPSPACPTRPATHWSDLRGLLDHWSSPFTPSTLRHDVHRKCSAMPSSTDAQHRLAYLRDVLRWRPVWHQEMIKGGGSDGQFGRHHAGVPTVRWRWTRGMVPVAKYTQSNGLGRRTTCTAHTSGRRFPSLSVRNSQYIRHVASLRKSLRRYPYTL